MGSLKARVAIFGILSVLGSNVFAAEIAFDLHVISSGLLVCFLKEYSNTISASASSPFGEVATNILMGS